MRYVLMPFSSPERVAWWLEASPEEQRADIARTLAWFREQREASRIVGNEELGWPASAKTVRRRGITDGPFIETKELLGGFIVVDVPDEATALAMAAAWPGLRFEGDGVEVRKAGDSVADAAAAGRAATG